MISMRVERSAISRGESVRATVTHKEHVGLLSSRFEVVLTIEMNELNLLIIGQTPDALEETLLEAPRPRFDSGEVQHYTLSSLRQPAMRIVYTFPTPAEARRFEARALVALTDIQRRLGDNDPVPTLTTRWDFP